MPEPSIVALVRRRIALAAASYHADTDSLSHSMLKVFRESSTLFYGRFVSKEIPAPEETASMRLGSLLHLAVLEPDKWDDGIAVKPGIDRRTKIGKELWEEFCESHKGRQIIDRDEHELVLAMTEAIYANDTCSQLLKAAGPVEAPIYWKDRSRRCKPDKVVHDAGGLAVCIIDLKTCADPSPSGFRKSMANFGYHSQAAWYQDGVADHWDVRLPFYFVAVGTKPPHDVAIYQASESALSLGRVANEQTLARIESCRQSGTWLNEWSKDIRMLDLPRWAEMGDYEGE